jgi:hypothetical protein
MYHFDTEAGAIIPLFEEKKRHDIFLLIVHIMCIYVYKKLQWTEKERERGNCIFSGPFLLPKCAVCSRPTK